MIKEFAEWLAGQNRNNFRQIKERWYHEDPSGRIHEIEQKEPERSAIACTTLTAVEDFLNENLDNVDLKEVFVTVQSYDLVLVASKTFGFYHQRHRFLMSKHHQINHRFNEWMDLEEFIIYLQYAFKSSGETEKENLLKFIGAVKVSREKNVEDDGISQKATVSQGITRIGQLEVPNPVTLKPYRTFNEIEQPQSKFVFRLRETPNGILAALFEADGGAWKNESVWKIKEYLSKNIPKGIIILA